jgi:hypothetical protein
MKGTFILKAVLHESRQQQQKKKNKKVHAV